ncbi:tripartite tricarboxylate transporter TctB family protein [Martelella limonii]|uniref:tripartite tricarboxylate transporter TctB family protein n=1 Tax=Martelella limonii TaxID=1647649 RepID=UPI001580F02B|nr:tripartite tricarboxylate transporter TctB family protein [Martelella limonii]
MFTAGLVCLSSLGIAVAFFWGSLGLTTLMSDPGGPAIVPRVLCGIIGLAALVEVVRLYHARHQHQSLGQTFSDFLSQVRQGVRAESSSTWRVLVCMILALLYPALMQLTGFIFASFALIVVIGRVCSLGWLRTLAIAIVMPLLLQFAFGTLLDARIPEGSIFDLSQIIRMG